MSEVTVSKTLFGKLPDGSEVDKYTLSNGSITVGVITYGATVQSLTAPDRHGVAGDIVLGFDTIEGYLENQGLYCGASVGRCANRIAFGKFKLDDKEYQLSMNKETSSLHGGIEGFSFRIWKATPRQQKDSASVEFCLTSPDGDMGYPGTLDVKVTYTLYSRDNKLDIDFEATTDKPTIVNLSNHSYFNLSGAATILDHELTVHAASYTPMDATMVPTGELAAVQHTPLDFTSPKPIGKDMSQPFAQFTLAHPEHGGYDFNWVLRSGVTDTPHDAVELTDRSSGRVMTMRTTLPGVQIYTANWFDGSLGKNKTAYGRFAGVAIEPQYFPDAPNHSNFPSIRLDPGMHYKHTATYTFSVV